MEKLTDLELIESSKISLQRTMEKIQDQASSVISLNLQWKEIEHVLDSAQSLVEEQHKALELKEEEFASKEKVFDKSCEEIEKDLERRHEDLEVRENECEQQCKEVRLKEKNLEKCLREYELKEEQLGLKEKIFVKRLMEFESEEHAFRERCRDLKTNVKHYEEEYKRLEVTEKLVQNQLEEIKAKVEEFWLKDKEYAQRCRDVELSENRLELRYCELEVNLKHFDERLRTVEQREKEIEELSTEHRRMYDIQSSDLEQRSNDLESKEKKLAEWSNDLESKDKKFTLWSKDFESKEKRLAEWSKDVESKEKKFVERSKELETKRRHAPSLHPHVKTEVGGIFSVKYSVDHNSHAHLPFCVNIDGKGLQMYLNNCWKEHGSIGNEVAIALQLSTDPANLVLDAMDGFYPPHLNKVDEEFEGEAARSSCILLLEQLMELSPEIKRPVRAKAMKLAMDWVAKLRVETGHELEVLGFLWLLASFRLADAFDEDELLRFLKFVAQHIQKPKIYKALGLENKITRFKIKTTSYKQQRESS